MRTILELEQVIAGSLLLFNKISKVDIELLVQFLSEKYRIEIVDNKLKSLIECVTIDEGNFLLKNNIFLENDLFIKQKLEKIAGKYVVECLRNVNILEFVLKKMNKLVSVRKDELGKYFAPEQILLIDKMINDGYINITWQDTCIYDNYEALSLSHLGEQQLFMSNYKNEINDFIEELKFRRYNIDLLNDYLKIQDFSKSIRDILNIESFQYFCAVYDRMINDERAVLLQFISLKPKGHMLLDSDSQDIMSALLSIINDSKCIFIGKTSKIFNYDIIRGKEEIKNIVWNDINYSSLYSDGCKMFFSDDYRNAFKYIHLKTNYIFDEYCDEDISCIAVVEERPDDELKYLVRGIVKRDKHGYSVAFNPEYEKNILNTNEEYKDAKSKLYVPI